MSRRAVLVGAGHAHLCVAKHAGEFVRRGIELTIVDPDTLWYSGLATGMLGGMYDPELDQIAPGPLIERHGGRFVKDRAVHLNTNERVVSLASGTTLPYDVVSFDVGSEVPLEKIPFRSADIWPVKPIRNLWHLRQHLEQQFHHRNAVGRLRVAVIGGGATGCEVAANIDALARLHGAPVQVTIISGSERLLPTQRSGASQVLTRTLHERGIEVALSCAVDRIEDGVAVTVNDRRFDWDVLVVAAGLRAPRWLGQCGLPIDEQGGLRVVAALHSIVNDRVFGAGDCISIEGHALPKLGVFGVRQGPILLHNLLVLGTGGEFRRYRPQKRYLSILNLGDGTGLATWGRLYWHGQACLWLKDRIDRRFLAQYRV